MRKKLLSWQWEGYQNFHGDKLNLWIHLLSAPLFIMSTFSVIFALANFAWVPAAYSSGSMMVAFMVQALGHAREKNPAIPFEGPGDAITRIFAEQLITFPRFVLSGGWWRAMKSAQG